MSKTIAAQSSSKSRRRSSRNSSLLKRAAYPIAGVAFAMAAGSLSRSASAQLYWDINGTDVGATNDGGGIATGSWDLATANWSTDSTGNSGTGTWLTGNTAIFSAGTNATGASTVTITAATTIPGVSNITFEEGTVTIAGGAGAALTLGTGGGTGIIQTDAANATISALISGADGLTKTGTGVLTLSNATNNYTGTVTVSAGTLAINNNLNLGDAANTIVMNGGTLRATTLAATMTRAISLGAGGGTFEMAGNASTFSGVISGAGNLTKTGTTTLVLGTANTYSGQTIISAATIVSNGINSLGDASVTNTITLAGGILRTSTGYNETRAITLTSAGGTLDSSAAAIVSTFSGNISGAFTLNKITAGTIILSGTNTHDTTAVAGGTLIANSAASLPNFATAGKVTAAAGTTVAVSAGGGGQWATADIDLFLQNAVPTGTAKLGINVDTANSYTHPSVISGAINFTKIGAGTLTLTGNNNYTGGTTGDAGTLIIGNAGTSTSGATTANSGGTILFNNTSGSGSGTGNVTAASGGFVGGTGTITNGGAGTITIAVGGHLIPGSGGVGTLTTDRLTINTDAATSAQLDFELAAPGTSDKVVSTFTGVTGTTGLTLNGGTFNFTNAGGLAAGTYTLIDYAGVLGGGVGNAHVGTAPGGFEYDLVNNTGNTSIDVTVTAAGATSNVANSWALDAVAGTEAPAWAQSVGSWSNAANWSAAAIPSGVDTPVTFGATSPDNHPHFIRAGSGTGKTIGSMTFSTATSNPHNAAYIISGGAPIVLDVSSGSATVTVTAGNQQVNTPITLNDPTIFNVSAGAMFQSGDLITGSALTKTGSGILWLAPARTNTVALTVSAGTLRGSVNAGIVGAPNVAGGSLQFYKTNGTFASVISGAGTVGWIYGPSGAAFIASAMTANNTFTGGFNTDGALFTLSGANGSVAASTSLEILHGSLILNNGTNNVNRINNSAPVTLDGAELSFIGNATVASTETIGQLRPNAGGQSYVTMTSTTGATLTAASLNPQGGGLLIVRGAAIGDSTGAFNQLKFTTPPTITGLTTPSATVLPNMYIEATAAGTGATAGLATYDVNGVRALAAGEYTDTAATGVNYAPTAAATVTGLTLNAIQIGGAGQGAGSGGGFTTTLSGTVTLTSGTILSKATSTSTITGGTLAFGASGAANGSIFNTNTVTFASAISSTGFAKSGVGQLTLTGANNFHGGTVSFNQGITVVNSTARLANAGSVHIGATGYSEAAGNGSRSGQLQLTSATGNYTAPLFIHGNYFNGTPTSLTSQSTFNNQSGNNTWSGDISLMGTELNTANQMYPGIGAIAGTLTLSGVIKDGVRADGNAVPAAFYTTGVGDIVFTGTAANTFSAFMRPFGNRLIFEKNGAMGGGNAYNDNLGVVMTQGAGTTNSRSTIAFRAPASASAGFNYSTFEWILFGGIGVNQNGVFLQNLGGANTFAGGIGFGSEYVEPGFTNSFHIDIQGSSSLTLQGPMAGRTASARDLQKDGTGSLIITGNNTGNVPVGSNIGTGSRFYVNAGSLTIGGASGSMPAGFSTYIVGPGASLTLDNVAGVSTTRIAATSRVALNGGELKLIGNATTSVSQSIAGGLDIGGFSIMTVSSPGASTTLNAGAFSRSNRGTVLLRGMNNTSTFIASTSTADLRGLGGGATTTTISILPYAVGDNNATGPGTDFVTIDGGNIRTLTSGEYTSALDPYVGDGTTARNNVHLTANVTTTLDRSANALKISGSGTSITIGSGKQIVIASGALLSTATGSSTISGGKINFDDLSVTEGEEGTVLALLTSEEGVITVPSGAALTISSVVAGAKGITKSGTGDLTLTGANTYGTDPVSLSLDASAKTTINSGILAVSTDGSLGNTGVPIYLNGGTLGATQTFTMNSSRGISLASAVANVIDVAATKILTVDGLVTGVPTTNSLTKSGGGTLALTNLGNTYSGPTNILGGYLRATTSAAQPQWGTGTININGGFIEANEDLTVDRNVVMAPTNTTGGFYVAATKTLTYGAAATSTVGISGSGDIIVDGGGTLALSQNTGAAMTYTGRLKVNNGTTLQFDTAGTNTLAGIGGTPVQTSQWVVLDNGARLRFNISSTAGAGFSSNVRGITINSGGGKIDVTGTNTVINTTGLFGTGNMTKEGAGLYSLRTNNATGSQYTGKIIVSAGTLEFGATGDNGTALGAATGADAITLLNGVYFQSTTTASVGTIPAAMGITIPSGATPTIAAKTGATLTIASPIVGASAAGVNFGGVNPTVNSGSNLSGTVILTGNSTYAGTTHLVGNSSGSILRVGVNDALPVGTILSLETNALGGTTTLDLQGNQTVASVAKTGSGLALITGGSTAIKTFTVNNSVSNTIDFPMTANLALKKTGTGSLTITTPATYAGSTTVQAGAADSTLTSGVNAALPAATTLILTNGSPGIARFDINSKTQTVAGISGNGIVSDTGGTGALTITGSITPGTAGTADTLTINTASILNTGVAFNYDLAATNTIGSQVNDLLVVTNMTSSLAGNTFTLNINALGGDVANANYTIIDGGAGTLDPTKFSIGTNNASGAHNYAFSIVSGDLILGVTSAGPNQWKDLSGSWGTASNWTNTIVPNAINDVALFGLLATAPRTVTVEAAKTVGTMTFNNANKYTLTGAAAVHISSTTTGLVEATLGSHDINAPVILDSNTTFAVAGVLADTLKVADLTSTGKNVTKTGTGTLEVDKVRSNAALTVSAGTLKITSSGGNEQGLGTKNSQVSSLSMTNGSYIDLTNNNLIIQSVDFADSVTKYAAAEALVISGFGNFDWLGTGIASSTAAAAAQIDGSRAVGIINNTDWGHSDIEGDPVGPNDIIVKYTWVADANVDGLVDNDDFGQFLFGFSGAGAANWLNGDFDYNGVVDNDDFGWFLTGLGAFNASGNTQLSDSFKAELAAFASEQGIPLVLDPTPVPEPSSAAVVGLIGAGMLARRRRNARKSS